MVTLHAVATLLHEVNRLERECKPQAAKVFLNRLGPLLAKEHLDAVWNGDDEIWIISDKLYDVPPEQ